MLFKLSKIFGTHTKAQEILFLLKDAKPVVRQGFYPSELPPVEKFCQENKIYLVKSFFKVLLADETAYSNKGIRVPLRDERRGMYFVYLSKEEQKAWLASYYELIGNDYDLGLLLGYPKCCVEFFCKRFSENNPNLQLVPTNPYTNLTKRERDCVLLSHFPCSSDCQESVELAKKYFFLIKESDERRAKEMLGVLSVHKEQ